MSRGDERRWAQRALVDGWAGRQNYVTLALADPREVALALTDTAVLLTQLELFVHARSAARSAAVFAQGRSSINARFATASVLRRAVREARRCTG